MALTFGSVASNLLHSTSTLTVPPSSFPPSLSPSSPTPTSTQSYSVFANPWDPGEGSNGGMNVQSSSSASNILPLGPVFGSSAVVLLAVVLTVRWKRHQTWRGVLGFGDGAAARGLALDSPGEKGDPDASRPCLWDAYISPPRVQDYSYRHWSDMKPVSASYAPPMPPPYPDLSDPLTACSTRTMHSGPTAMTALQNITSTTQKNADCTCQERQVTPPNLPVRRLRVSVLISMPAPPRPHRTYDNHDDDHSYQQQHDNDEIKHENDNIDDLDDCRHSSTSSFSEIEEEKMKARAAMNRRERTADLSLVLGIAEVDVYDVDSYGRL